MSDIALRGPGRNGKEHWECNTLTEFGCNDEISLGGVSHSPGVALLVWVGEVGEIFVEFSLSLASLQKCFTARV